LCKFTFYFLGQWDSNIPLEETKIDEDDNLSYVINNSFFL
jgi:hypothetical protein